MSTVEVNFDGLVGPTHNYAGLSEGNLASDRNKDAVARPKMAALQGLAKMRRLMALGLPQGVLAPMERPNLPWLRALGFTGTDRMVWEAAAKNNGVMARIAASASTMWAANAGTVSPSPDTADGRAHFSVANLVTMPHRAQENGHTARLFARMFADEAHFAVHPALPAQATFADEGAANHMRLASAHGERGIEIFVYGRSGFEPQRAGFPARQTLEACQAIARRHGTDMLYWRQSDVAIDAGAFHNDVVAVANADTLFCHAGAFADLAGAKESLSRAAQGRFEPQWVIVPEDAVSLSDAVSSYLFNSQLVSPPGANRMTLIAPGEVQETPKVWDYVQGLIAGGGPVGAVEIVDVRESMKNGGGPACLRFRVVLTQAERAAMTQGFLLTPALADALEAWVSKHYRDTLALEDLADFSLVQEAQTAMDDLTHILPLGSDFYAFQR